MQSQQLEKLDKAKAILSDYTLYILKDRAFGDMEVHWSYPDPDDSEYLRDIASGYFGYDYSDKKSVADVHIIHADLSQSFTGDDAHELLNHYSRKIITYNDSQGE